MNLFLWIYLVVGNLYFLLYAGGSEIVTRYAVGPIWLMMVAAPVILGLLVFVPIAHRLGFFGSR